MPIEGTGELADSRGFSSLSVFLTLFIYYNNCMLSCCNVAYVSSDIFLIRYRSVRLLSFGHHRYSSYASTCRAQARGCNAGLGK